MENGRHLTQDQLSAWVIGDRTPEILQHLRSCSACNAEALLLETTLFGFRGAVREWTREHATPAVMPATALVHPSFFTFNRACVAMAAAIICVLLGVMLRQPNSAVVERTGISDRALMSEVDDQVSSTVPAAMEPLLDLVAWQGDGRGDTGELAGTMPGKDSRLGAAKLR